ncbi:MAG: response regulator transcription factor [Acidimicrobiales bacterium]
MARILVIDDELPILRALSIGLRAKGYELLTAQTGEDGLARAASYLPDVIVLDLGLPDLDGVDVCLAIRAWSDVPIVVLSAHGAEERKVAALDSGADDFVTKPFGMGELEARLRVALRHRRSRSEPEPAVAEVGALRVDLARRQVTIHDEVIELTAREFDLLAYLARHAGKVLTHHLILEEVWGPGYGEEVQYLWVYSNRLRRKLGDDKGRLLRTISGTGYQLVAEADT